MTTPLVETERFQEGLGQHVAAHPRNYVAAGAAVLARMS
jgi:hypothetical protein